MKYLGIIIDNKFKFSEHIRYAAEKCTKLIHSLSKLVKISWGLKHGALKTIQGVRTRLREGVPYVKLYRKTPKHLYP
jgi:hypothetical protein